MKIISAMFGGSVSSNDKKFFDYAKNEIKYFKSFPVLEYFKQCLIFIVLKLSLKILYKLIFFQILKFAHIKILFLSIVYPSLKFKKK